MTSSQFITGPTLRDKQPFLSKSNKVCKVTTTPSHVMVHQLEHAKYSLASSKKNNICQLHIVYYMKFKITLDLIYVKCKCIFHKQMLLNYVSDTTVKSPLWDCGFDNDVLNVYLFSCFSVLAEWSFSCCTKS